MRSVSGDQWEFSVETVDGDASGHAVDMIIPLCMLESQAMLLV